MGSSFGESLEWYRNGRYELHDGRLTYARLGRNLGRQGLAANAGSCEGRQPHQFEIHVAHAPWHLVRTMTIVVIVSAADLTANWQPRHFPPTDLR